MMISDDFTTFENMCPQLAVVGRNVLRTNHIQQLKHTCSILMDGCVCDELLVCIFVLKHFSGNGFFFGLVFFLNINYNF